jgi:hypothetical protein
MRIDLTFDTRNAEALAEFWKLALDYEDEPPPPPFATRDEWAASFRDADAESGDAESGGDGGESGGDGGESGGGESDGDESDGDESDGESGGGAWLHDPTGQGPRLSFLDVPEPKVAKNRLHLDIRVGKGDDSWPRIQAKAAQLEAAGGHIQATFDGHHIVMTDPEGNEFCVAA